MKFFYILSKFFTWTMKKQYAYHSFHSLCSSGYQMILNKPTLFSLCSLDTSQSGSTNQPGSSTQYNLDRSDKQSLKSEQHLQLPSIVYQGLGNIPFHRPHFTNCKNQQFPRSIYKESKEKTSLRTGSSWFGFLLTSIKKRSWKLYLPRATTFPLGICSKTPKLNITYGLTLISLNTKLHNYPRILHKQISNLVDWGSLYARHH